MSFSPGSSILTKGLQSSFSQKNIFPHNILKVYSCVSDISKYSEFIPGIKRSRIISFSNISEHPTSSLTSLPIGPIKPVPTVTFAELQVDVVAVQLRYISRVISIPYQSIEVGCGIKLIIPLGQMFEFGNFQKSTHPMAIHSPCR